MSIKHCSQKLIPAACLIFAFFFTISRAATVLISRSNDSTICVSRTFKSRDVHYFCNEHGKLLSPSPLPSLPMASSPTVERCARLCLQTHGCETFDFLVSTSTCHFYSDALKAMGFRRRPNQSNTPLYSSRRCWKLSSFNPTPLVDGNFEDNTTPSSWTAVVRGSGSAAADVPGAGNNGTAGAFVSVTAAEDLGAIFIDPVTCPGSIYALEYEFSNPTSADLPLRVLLNGIYFDQPQQTTASFVRRSDYFTTQNSHVHMVLNLYAPYNYSGGHVAYYLDNFQLFAVDADTLPPGTTIIQA